jgi:hypothetical protein
MSLTDMLHVLDDRLKVIEARFEELGYSMKAIVQSEFKKKFKVDMQSECMYGMYTALCVDTADPWKQNRVRFYSPLLHKPDTQIKALPWAHAISSMGGFDDSGLSWVPPAGSTLCLVFENGSRSAPYYLGTTWHRTRGKTENARNFGYNIDEFYKIHEGHRKGYLVGPNDGSQVLPPWGTEGYNGADITSTQDFFLDPDVQKNLTYQHIYGHKTPGKHAYKAVDGDPKCNNRFKRVEIYSGDGNWFMMKDDALHPAGQWSNPRCGGGEGTDITGCHGDAGGILADFGPVEGGGCPPVLMDAPPLRGLGPKGQGVPVRGGNKYFKHENECRPYRGVGTPMNTVADLPQTGMQLISIGGATFVMDDSVDEPSRFPAWENSTKKFDFGCNDRCLGRTYWMSMTGHSVLMEDYENLSGNRGEENGIFLETAGGSRIAMSDHTVGGTAGPERGIKLTSTSRNEIFLCDDGNEQAPPQRRNGGVPTARANKAFIRIRTGYGLEMMFRDQANQESTQQQYIQIFCPQKDNQQRGPHLMRFQEKPAGPGQVFLRAGGDCIISTYDNLVESVGDKEQNPSNKIEIISKHKVLKIEKLYYNKAETHVLQADKNILLLAEYDCPVDGRPNPCVYPVIVGRCPEPCPLFPWMIHWTEKAMSEYVFASAKNSKDVCD